MFDKVLNLIQNNDLIVPRILLQNYKDFNMTDQELIVTIYLINNKETYNPKNISNELKIELIDFLTIINGLSEKGILKTGLETKEGKKTEVLDLSPLYNKLTFKIVNEEKEEVKDTSIYTAIENEFARALSPIEYDIVTSWLDASYSEELIKEALKEAVYNNVTSLKYIDRILEEWHKKGIKNKMDVINANKKFKEHKQIKKDDSLEYDWLNEE